MNSYAPLLALSLLTAAACPLPGDGTTTGDVPTTSGSASSEPASDASGPGTSSSTGAPAADASTTGEASLACYGDPCVNDECGPGLTCLPHPTTGEGMCVTWCLTAAVCNLEAVICEDAPKVPKSVCINGGCFPRTCIALADCPNTSIECLGGVCY